MSAPNLDKLGAAWRFLMRLRDGQDIGVATDRIEDRARQWCRRNGYAVFVGGRSGKNRGWAITPAGENVLKEGRR